MNLGDNRWHRKYICDKCKEPIPYIVQKGIPVNKYWKQRPASNPPKMNFDLCDACEKEFRKWLDESPIPTPERMINKFPVYQKK